MAADLGMSVADILDIEKGVAMDSRATHGAVWLTRMETWSAGKREHALQAANRQGVKSIRDGYLPTSTSSGDRLYPCRHLQQASPQKGIAHG